MSGSLSRVEQPTAPNARRLLDTSSSEWTPYQIAAVAEEALSLAASLRVAVEALRPLRKIVDAQAEDEALWAIYPFGEQPIVEAYLQQELRALHAAVETALASVEDEGCADK